MARALQPGDTLGRYVLVEELGRGGMAVVFRARDPALGREVAVKVMHPHLWGREDHVARFAREARAVAALRHPNIVEVHDFAAPQGEETPGFIVSELVSGPTLRAFLDEHGHPLPEVAAMVVHKLAGALGAAHERGIVHRDIKPENVMIARGGRVVLADFGVARVSEGTAVTQTGAMVGSPAYMSPEQAKGQAIDGRSDLFSLGTVFYLLCTGSLPFVGRDPISTALHVLSGTYEPPTRREPRVGRRIERIIDRLLRVSPDERYGSAGELQAALAEVIDAVGAAGATDIDAELRRYFEDPAAFDPPFASRLVVSTYVQARRSAAAGDHASALALCDRVLAFDADHPETLGLLAEMSAAGGRRRVVLAAVIVSAALASGVAAWALLGRRPLPPGGPAPAATPRADARSARILDGGVAVVAPASDVPPAADSATTTARRIPRRRRLAPRPAAIRPDAAPPGSVAVHAASDARAAPRVPGPAQILVRIGPWCEVLLDGRRVGISPMTTPVRVAPGDHVVTCRFHDGRETTRRVRVAAGTTETVEGAEPVRVLLGLREGDAVLVAGRPHHSGERLRPKRYRVDLLRAGRVLRGAWVSIPSRDCTLVDVPELECR